MSLKVITQIAPLSLARILGALYAVLGFIAGVWVIGSSMVFPSGSNLELSLNYLWRALIFIPFSYLLFGLLAGFIFAFFYNTLVRFLKGIEINLEDKPHP